jgi:RHS repeat-associated protein
VEKTGGSNPTEVVYFGGKPVALLNPSTGAWTDLIWAGNNMLAEVAGNQTATPVYRLLDHEGSLVATTDNSGNVTGSNLIAPYGQLMASGTSDPYLYANLFQDTEYGGHDAWYRNFSAEEVRWLTPDPYNGSYDLNNPQSLNRYAYVNDNPLGFTDPSGLAGAGVLTGIGGNLCLGGGPGQPGDIFNFCDPLISAISVGLFGTSAYVPVFSFAVTLGCSFAPSSDTTSSLCGQSGWTSAVFTGEDKWVGTAINDSVATVGLVDALAIPGAAAAAGYTSSFAYLTSCITGPSDPVCDVAIALAVYTALNDIFSVFWDAFGGGGPQFTGSLLPRPSDLGGLGTSPIGIPNQNLSIKGILGQPSPGAVASPGMNIQ